MVDVDADVNINDLGNSDNPLPNIKIIKNVKDLPAFLQPIIAKSRPNFLSDECIQNSSIPQNTPLLKNIENIENIERLETLAALEKLQHIENIKTQKNNTENKDFKNPEDIENLEKNAYQKALRLLSYRDYSNYGMAQKLKAADYSGEIIAKVIQTLKEKGWLDDLRMAESILHRYQRYGQLKINQIMKKEGIALDIQQQALQKFKADQRLFNESLSLHQMNESSHQSNQTSMIDEDLTTPASDSEFKKACDLYAKKFMQPTRLSVQTLNSSHQIKTKNENENENENEKNIENIKKIQQKNKQKQIRFLLQKGFNYSIALKVIDFFNT